MTPGSAYYIHILFSFCFIFGAYVVLSSNVPIIRVPSTINQEDSCLLGSTGSIENDSFHEVLASINAAMQSHGVFILSFESFRFNSNAISALQAAKNIFSLPIESKQDIHMKSAHINRGYLSFGSESGLGQLFEPKEGFSYGHPSNGILSGFNESTCSSNFTTSNWLRGPNIWPREWLKIEDFSQSDKGDTSSVEVSEEVEALGAIFVQLTACAVNLLSGIDSYRTLNQFSKINLNFKGGAEISVMRIFHYFALETSPIVQNAFKENPGLREKAMGSSPHTDWGLLTLIIQNEVTGLQFFNKNSSEWVDVPFVPNSIIVNVGDYFSLKSKGEYHSPIHRVTCPIAEDRFSFVLFYYPAYDSPMLEDKQITDRISDFEFNTLSSSDSRDSKDSSEIEHGGQIEFGDYILDKWKGVYRGKLY